MLTREERAARTAKSRKQHQYSVADYRIYPGPNVYEAALDRIRQVYAEYDHVAVAFSGGKDSLTVLHLARQVAEEQNKLPVRAVFRDEELIPFDVVRFVEQHRGLDWLDLEWWAIPLQSHRKVFAAIMDYVQWDPNRKHIRPRPDWAVTEPDLGLQPGQIVDQYTADDLIFHGRPGSAAILMGIRAAESYLRLKSAMTKRGPLYWQNTSSNCRALTCNPIIDWEEDDVFRFFYDHGITYCAHYDDQMWTESEFRVCSVITSEGSNNFDYLMRQDPELWDRIVQVFPGTSAQQRYKHQLTGGPPPDNWQACHQWVDDHLEGRWHERASRGVRYLEANGGRLDQAWSYLHRGAYKHATAHFELARVARSQAATTTD
jgi:predicted phosphoadenosine phosphosulfate sulfurtransferase